MAGEPLTFAEIHTWAVERLHEIAEALQAAGKPRPHVFPWWEQGMADPAAYIWLEPTTETAKVDTCTVRDDVRLVLAIATRPGASTGSDMASVAEVLDVAIPIVNTGLASLALRCKRPPARQGLRLVEDEANGPGSPKPLVVELPVTVPWFQTFTPTP